MPLTPAAPAPQHRGKGLVLVADDESAVRVIFGAETAIRWWQSRGEDPRGKLVIFSDGLDVEKIESGRLDIAFERLSPAQLVRQAELGIPESLGGLTDGQGARPRARQRAHAHRVVVVGEADGPVERPEPVAAAADVPPPEGGMAIAVFVITSEGGVAQGVRRIEGVTGAAALDYAPTPPMLYRLCRVGKVRSRPQARSARLGCAQSDQGSQRSAGSPPQKAIRPALRR